MKLANRKTLLASAAATLLGTAAAPALAADWPSGFTKCANELAVADATTGAVLEGPVSTALNIDQFQDMTTAPNGDVLWAHSTGGGFVGVNRVAACKLTN